MSMNDNNDPYINKEPGDLLTAETWNSLQSQVKEHINDVHDHGGIIADGKVDGSKIDPDSEVAIKKLTVDDIEAKTTSTTGLTTGTITSDTGTIESFNSKESTIEKLTVKTELIAPNVGGGVPAGTIIDFYRFDKDTPIPEGFQVCDGKKIEDEKSPFKGKQTPDLIGRFIMGASEEKGEREEGGTRGHQHSFSISPHSHQFLSEVPPIVKGDDDGVIIVKNPGDDIVLNPDDVVTIPRDDVIIKADDSIAGGNDDLLVVAKKDGNIVGADDFLVVKKNDVALVDDNIILAKNTVPIGGNLAGISDASPTLFKADALVADTNVNDKISLVGSGIDSRLINDDLTIDDKILTDKVIDLVAPAFIPHVPVINATAEATGSSVQIENYMGILSTKTANNLGTATGTTDNVSNLPPYIGLLKLMKIW